MTPQISLKLTFDWFKIFYLNKNDKKKVINFTFEQIKNFKKIIRYY